MYVCTYVPVHMLMHILWYAMVSHIQNAWALLGLSVTTGQEGLVQKTRANVSLLIKKFNVKLLYKSQSSQVSSNCVIVGLFFESAIS